MSQDAISVPARRWMRRWLILTGLMVYAMILIGGATRLTDSGLSITEWSPIKGALPPFGEAGWLTAFEKYKSTAEFQQQNYNMSLAEFQYIYWWEWSHRLFGRLIGLVAMAGFVIFVARRWLTRKWLVRLAVLIGLGGLQGAIGWWMVASGMGETSRIDVAPYRLATHFGLALLIIGVTAWFWLDLGAGRKADASGAAQHWALGLFGLICVQMLAGALVAGLDAGRSYTDWPLMAGEVVPSDYIDQALGWRSLFEGREATQFNHRLLAYTLWALSLVAAFRLRRGPAARGFAGLAALITLQAIWGIVTLVNAAPMPLALVHQALGVAVLLVAVWLVWLNLGAGQGSDSRTSPG